MHVRFFYKENARKKTGLIVCCYSSIKTSYQKRLVFYFSIYMVTFLQLYLATPPALLDKTICLWLNQMHVRH